MSAAKIVINGEFVELGGGSGGEIYSTEETKIGTWIDGRPIYRKVAQTVSPSKVNAWEYVYTELHNVAFMCRVSQIIHDKSGEYVYYNYSTSGGYEALSYNPDNGIKMHVSHANYVSVPVTLIMEYTKIADSQTTDASGTESSQTATSTPSVSKSGKVTHDGIEYDYEIPDSAFSYASASASSTYFGLS